MISVHMLASIPGAVRRANLLSPTPAITLRKEKQHGHKLNKTFHMDPERIFSQTMATLEPHHEPLPVSFHGPYCTPTLALACVCV